MAYGYGNSDSSTRSPLKGFQLCVLATLLLNFPEALSLSRERQGRILNGPSRQPVTATALNNDSWVQASGNSPSASYAVVRPPQNFWPNIPYDENEEKVLEINGNDKVPPVVVPAPVTSTQEPYLPDPLPSINNHRINIQERVYNNSQVEMKNNVHRIAITLPPIRSTPTALPNPADGKKKRKRVNLEKFRECVFFHYCPKAECFHFGRFGQCKTEKNEV